MKGIRTEMNKETIDNEAVLHSLDFGLGDDAVSHNETTGLIPSAPVNQYELDSYKEIDEYQQVPITEDN
ncbi:MAG: hypothetical protein J1G06_01295 [Oscillospiraceae bacterium]|nr:hypothetical protein [Oscillospiraceae bacterium]